MGVQEIKINCIFFVCLLFMVLVFMPATAAEFEYTYNSAQARDIFMPLVNNQGEVIIDQDKKADALNLEGIIYTPPQSQVIINNQVYQRGDKIKQRTIIKIKEKSVVIEEKNGKLTIMKWED